MLRNVFYHQPVQLMLRLGGKLVPEAHRSLSKIIISILKYATFNVLVFSLTTVKRQSWKHFPKIMSYPSLRLFDCKDNPRQLSLLIHKTSNYTHINPINGQLLYLLDPQCQSPFPVPFSRSKSKDLTLPAAIAKKWSTQSQVIIASPTKLLPEIRYLHVAVI